MERCGSGRTSTSAISPLLAAAIASETLTRATAAVSGGAGAAGAEPVLPVVLGVRLAAKPGAAVSPVTHNHALRQPIPTTRTSDTIPPVSARPFRLICLPQLSGQTLDAPDYAQ